MCTCAAEAISKKTKHVGRVRSRQPVGAAGGGGRGAGWGGGGRGGAGEWQRRTARLHPTSRSTCPKEGEKRLKIPRARPQTRELDSFSRPPVEEEVEEGLYLRLETRSVCKLCKRRTREMSSKIQGATTRYNDRLYCNKCPTDRHRRGGQRGGRCSGAVLYDLGMKEFNNASSCD